VGDGCDVSFQHSAAHGVAEGATNDQVDLEHGFGGQGLGTWFDGMKFRVVQRFELVDLEPTNGNAPEGGKDVAFDLAPVAVPGRLGQRDLLVGEPLAGQKRAEGERPDTVVGTVDLSSQFSGELLGFGLVGASTMPGPDLLAGDRVEPLVDDGVVLLALLRGVALHDCSPSGHPGIGHPVEQSVEVSRVANGAVRGDVSSLWLEE